MCGISGYNWPEKVKAEEMNRIKRFRGPDDSGIYTDKNITLAHTRLSIIDLSNAGHQPMSNEDGTIWITYNGEIYNASEIRKDLEVKGHIFKSRSDTEVIIHAYEQYGDDCLHKFNGMWAFCIYDINKKELFISRDRFGIKPLFYYLKNGTFIFSSMISAILSQGIRTSPNIEAVMKFLAFRLVAYDNATLFQDIHSLEPGHKIKFNLEKKSIEIKKWYKLESREGVSPEKIRELFEQSVSYRTVSDVPVGSCLSGGLDSSAIVCALSKVLENKVDTYSYVIPGHRLDETKYINEIGKITGSKQHFVSIDEDIFLDDFEDFTESQEEPVCGLAVYVQYLVMRLAHENGAKVLLDGQGGDEIFAGYNYYPSYYFCELLRKLKIFTLAGESFISTLNSKELFPVEYFMFLLLPDNLKKYFFRNVQNKWVNFDCLMKSSEAPLDPRWERLSLDEILRLTLFSTAIPHLLRWEDKNAMRWSVETRLPFLDPALVEAAYSLPAETKLKSGRTKVLFREQVADLVPSMVLNRKDKLGFETPDVEFFRKKKIADYCKDIIYSEDFKKQPFWNWRSIEKQYSEFLKGRNNRAKDVMQWISLGVWLKKFF